MVYAVRNFSYFQDQFAMEIVNDYFALLAQKDTIRNRYTNYLGRVQPPSGWRPAPTTASAVRRGPGPPGGADRQEQLRQLPGRYRNSLDQFKITLGLPVGEKTASSTTGAGRVEQNRAGPAPLDRDAAYRVAVDQAAADAQRH